jgi:hypothetical protein
MAKVKISATLDPARLERAKELTGVNNVSEVLERGLAAPSRTSWNESTPRVTPGRLKPARR